MDTSSRAGRVVSVSSLYWRSALESRRNSPRELGHGSPAGAQLLARHWEMQGADTALPAGDRDLINSVISRPDYLKGTGSGAFSSSSPPKGTAPSRSRLSRRWRRDRPSVDRCKLKAES